MQKASRQLTDYSMSTVQWYNDKLTELAPLHSVYLKPTATNTAQFVELSRQNWSNMIDVLQQVEQQLEGPFALGDQISLADLHVIAYLARLMAACCQLEGEKDELVALEKALQHDCLKDNVYAKGGVSLKVSAGAPSIRPDSSDISPLQLRTYWTAIKSRPSFQAVYGGGLH